MWRVTATVFFKTLYFARWNREAFIDGKGLYQEYRRIGGFVTGVFRVFIAGAFVAGDYVGNSPMQYVSQPLLQFADIPNLFSDRSRIVLQSSSTAFEYRLLGGHVHGEINLWGPVYKMSLKSMACDPQVFERNAVTHLRWKICENRCAFAEAYDWLEKPPLEVAPTTLRLELRI